MIVRASVRIMANGREFAEVALVDTSSTSTIIDRSLAEELGLRPFGERAVSTLGALVRCQMVDVGGMALEGEEIGPRRVLVHEFPTDVKGRLRSLACSDKVIIGVAEVESAGYMPNTTTGKLEKVGFIALISLAS